MPILDKEYEKIIIETVDGIEIASISNEGDTPVSIADGYVVRLIPTSDLV